MVELLHRTNFLGLKKTLKKKRERKTGRIVFYLHFVKLGHYIKGIKAL